MRIEFDEGNFVLDFSEDKKDLMVAMSASYDEKNKIVVSTSIKKEDLEKIISFFKEVGEKL